MSTQPLKVTKQLIQCRALDIALVAYCFSMAGAYLSSDFLPNNWWMRGVTALSLMIIGSLSIVSTYYLFKRFPQNALLPPHRFSKFVLCFVVIWWLYFFPLISGVI